MTGDESTGVSVMVLTEGMDEGPVIARREEPIDPDDTSATLGSRLADVGAGVLVDALDDYVTGTVVPQPQDDAAATYAPKITTADARIDWSADARAIRDLVRALDPEPGAWTTFGGTRLKVLRVQAADGPALAPGAISTAEGLIVGTGSGSVALEEVQPATKKRMSGADFARGARLGDGARMGE
jgi:methionyl-tRNA formyltransferase